MKENVIIQRIKDVGLPYTEVEFKETIETPFPELPYLIYIKPLIELRKARHR